MKRGKSNLKIFEIIQRESKNNRIKSMKVIKKK